MVRIVMAHTVAAFTVMACTVMAYSGTAYVVVAYIVLAYIAIAYMADGAPKATSPGGRNVYVAVLHRWSVLHRRRWDAQGDIARRHRE